MQYDGSGKLGEAIADLYGLSPKSQAQIAKLIGQAKDGLGIISKSKRLPDDVKLAIYRWHYERLNPVQDIKQVDNVQDNPVQSADDTIIQYVKPIAETRELSPDSIVQNVKQDNVVYDVKQNDAAQDIKQDAPIQLDDDYIQDGTVYDYDQVHFGVVVKRRGQPKRTTVMLEGYLVKALQRKHGLTNNAAIRVWVEQAIKNDSKFDSHESLTKQVKRMIIESFI
ncbi:MAG: hypothetical protein ACXWTS_02535 [Methylococcaceae bacterium]